MRGLITAGLRIICIFVFLNTLSIVLNNISIYISGRNSTGADFLSNTISYIIVFFITLLLIWILWWKADKIAAFLSGNLMENQLTINTSNTELMQTIMKILGVSLIVLTLPTICGHIGYYLRETSINSTFNSPYYYDSRPSPYEVLWWITDGVKIIIGILLIFGMRGIIQGIVKIWNKARMTDEIQETDSTDAERTLNNNNPDN